MSIEAIMIAGATHSKDLDLQTVPANDPLPELSPSWWPEPTREGATDFATSHLVVRPMLGESAPLGAGLAVTARDVLRALNIWSTQVPELEVTITGTDTPERRLETAWERLGYTALAPQAGWHLLDLSSAPMWRLADQPETLPVRLPSLCFEPHTLVCIAQLGTHPTERMVGCLATLLGGLPDASLPNVRAVRPELTAYLLRLWPPDLCILDARHVRRWDEIDTFDNFALGRVIIGRDPLAVDVAGARLLGLQPDQVPLLTRVRRMLRRPWPDVAMVPPLMAGPAPSRHFAEAQMRDFGWRTTRRFGRAVEKTVRRADLPRLLGFVRRVQEGL